MEPTMDTADRYANQINQLLKQPGRIDRKLKAAISKYEKLIEKLKGVALLESSCGLTEVYKASLDLMDRTARYISAVESTEQRFTKLSSPAHEICLRAQPYIKECDRASRRLHLSKIKDYISYYDSTIDAARLINDDEVLVASLRDYLQFIFHEVEAEEQCLPVLLQETASLENCLNTVKSLVSKFDALLEEIGLPVVPAGYLEKADSQTWEDEQLERFAVSFQQLASLKTSHLNVLLKEPISNVISLPMQLILSPLEKRFRYHFCGSKKTNRPDKPEWYMTQILQWIRDNDYVLTIVDRDFVDECALKYSLRVEFMRGLVRLLVDKLEFDLGLRKLHQPRYSLKFDLRSADTEWPRPGEDLINNPAVTPSGDLIDNVEYFGHLIDIVLQTGARLTQLAYPSDQPCPTDILSLPEIFSRWLLLEKKLASGRLDDLLSAPNAWVTVSEENRRPQCADDFVALLHAVGLRGRQLNDRVARTRFLRVQLGLIKLFHKRLVSYCAQAEPRPTEAKPSESVTDETARTTGGLGRLFGALGAVGSGAKVPRVQTALSWFGDHAHPIQSGRWIPVLNALVHIRDTLTLLANDNYYVSFWEESATRSLLQAPDPWMIDLGLEGDKLEVHDAVQSHGDQAQSPASHTPVPPVPELDERQGNLHGGVFDQLLRVYQKEIDRMTKETVRAVMYQLTSKAGPYIHATDLWLQPSPVSGITGGINMDTSGMQWSSAASDMLICLRDWLFQLSQTLHPKVFPRVWQQIARELDDFFYKKLILGNRFSPGGAAQLRFDLTQCVYPMFALYTDRPEAMFAQTRDATVLLNLLRGSAELLRDSLRASVSGESHEGANNPLAPLLELGVYLLTPDDALLVLSRRASPE